jgi:hypothetical protein
MRTERCGTILKRARYAMHPLFGRRDVYGRGESAIRLSFVKEGVAPRHIFCN